MHRLCLEYEPAHSYQDPCLPLNSAALKIQIVLPFTSLTGGNMILIELANRLRHRGHDVWMLYRQVDIPFWKPRGFLRTKLRDAGILPWLTWHPLKVPVVRCTEFSDAQVPNADILIASNWREILNIEKLSPSKGRKIYYVQAYETDFVEDVEEKAKRDATYHAKMEYVVVAEWIGKVLKQNFGQESIKICPPLADEMFENIPPRRPFTGKCLMQHHRPLAKGIGDGIEAFELARKQCPDLSLTLFGPHSHEAPDCFERLGQISTKDMPTLYDDFDIFIWPSLKEGFGLPPLEAMARGLAVATTDNGGSGEFAVDGKTSLVSPPGDIQSLARNLVRLVQDANLRFNLRSEGSKLAQTQFTWDMMCAKFERLIFTPISRVKSPSLSHLPG
jgi:glycosyltransferase involved in cell wall biosynthesis